MKKTTEIHFEIERNCVLNCKHCSSISLRERRMIGFTLQDAKKIIALYDDNLHVYLTGGEPLISEGLLNYIRELNAVRNGIAIGIFTCGIVNKDNVLTSISYEKAQALKEAGLEDCYISVYHFDEKKHEEITTQRNSLQYTVESIKNLLAVGVDVKAHLVLNGKNIEDIDEVIQYLVRIGVCEIRLLRLVYGGNAVKNWDDIGVEYSKQNEVIEKLFERKDCFPVPITISGFPHLTPCRPFAGAQKCQGGTNVLYVTYEGLVYPCACTKGIAEFEIGRLDDIEAMRSFVQARKEDYHEECLNPLTENIEKNYLIRTK